MCYLKSADFIEFLRNFCIYVCMIMLGKGKELLNLKDLKLGQFLCIDKTCFLRPGQNYIHIVSLHEELGLCTHNTPTYVPFILFVSIFLIVQHFQNL